MKGRLNRVSFILHPSNGPPATAGGTDLYAADRALKLSPDSTDAHYLAGLARASLGQRDAALLHLARLKQLTSPDLAQQLSDFIDKKAPAKQ